MSWKRAHRKKNNLFESALKQHRHRTRHVNTVDRPAWDVFVDPEQMKKGHTPSKYVEDYFRLLVMTENEAIQETFDAVDFKKRLFGRSSKVAPQTPMPRSLDSLSICMDGTVSDDHQFDDNENNNSGNPLISVYEEKPEFFEFI